jgi:hypothetical protein
VADSYKLTGPGGGTTVELASYTTAEVDFGTRGLLRAQFAESPYSEGALSFESVGVRRMTFPLLLRGSQTMPGLSLEAQEELLRRLARPGGYLDLRVDTASQAVRFDLLSGRYEPDHDPQLARIGARRGRLELDVTPYGYLPTWVTLASSASVGAPGTLGWSASIPGDAPALGRIAVEPSVVGTVGATIPDQLILSVTHRASHLAFLAPASIALLDGASLIGVAAAPASQAVEYYASANQSPTGWKLIGYYTVATTLEPAMRGRYRMWGWFHQVPSQIPRYVMADSSRVPTGPLASAGQVATIPADATYALLDLGRLSLPPVGSGMVGPVYLRLWSAPATSFLQNVASPAIRCGGMYLQTLDSDYAAALASGLTDTAGASPGRLVVDAYDRVALISDRSVSLGSAVPYRSALGGYFGPLPRLASGVRLDVAGAARATTVNSVACWSTWVDLIGSQAPKAWFKLNEAAGPTLIDARGSWHGSWVVAPSLGVEGAVGSGAFFDGASQAGNVASVLHGWATSWTIEFWARRASDIANLTALSHGFQSTGIGFRLSFTPGAFQWSFWDGQDLNAADAFPGPWTHWMCSWDYNTRGRAIYRNGSLIASLAAVTTYQGSGPLRIADRIGVTNKFYAGYLDEIVIHVGTALGQAVAASHALATTATTGGGTTISAVAVHRPMQAAVSVQCRPRFQFMRGL